MKRGKKYIVFPKESVFQKENSVEILNHKRDGFLLKYQLEIIIDEINSSSFFIKENDPGFYLEILEYKNAIQEAIANENYIDMKNLFEQWDPNSQLHFRDFTF